MARYIDPDVTQGVNIGFTAIMIVPLIAITCITYSRARRLKDAARVTTTYFKTMLPLAILYVQLHSRQSESFPRAPSPGSRKSRTSPTDFIVNRWLVLYMIAGILSMVYNRGNLDGEIVYHAQLRISSLSNLFNYLTDLLLIMTLVEMGNGLLFCLTQTRTRLQMAMRYAAITTCVILAMLTIALFGVQNAEYSQSFNSRWYGFGDALYVASRRMSSALYILTFVWSLVLLIFAAIVFHKTKRNYVLKNVSRATSLLQHCQQWYHLTTCTDAASLSSQQCSSSSPLS